MKLIDDLKDKRVLILGFAREGVSVLKFLRRNFLDKKIAIYDRKKINELDEKYQKILIEDFNLELFLGVSEKFLNELILKYDLVIKSAGVSTKIFPSEVRLWLKTHLTTSTNIFFDLCPGMIIGITGTKGKSTTSSLIYEILKTDEKKTIFLGNIGKPCLDYLDQIDENYLVVFELSSHQLSNLKSSPHIAVFLNLYPEHLDYYENIGEYIKAKSNIFKFHGPNDYLIYNQDDPIVKRVVKSAKANKVPFGVKEFKNLRIKTKLLGQFNQLNILAAKKVAQILGIAEKTFATAESNFSPLTHRLELIGKYQDITFYNDSLSTIPQASIGALDALGSQVLTMIAGGYDRGLDFRKLAVRILKSRVKNLILFPTTGEKIRQEILRLDKKAVKRFHFFAVSEMKTAVDLAYKNTTSGKICLLSCASPSFGVFKDYADRGEQFKKYVSVYGLEKTS